MVGFWFTRKCSSRSYAVCVYYITRKILDYDKYLGPKVICTQNEVQLFLILRRCIELYSALERIKGRQELNAFLFYDNTRSIYQNALSI